MSLIEGAHSYTTDWLGSKPIFYNKLSGKVSYNINDVIDHANFEWDPEGLRNYLQCGFSFLGRTAIKNVEYLTHSATLDRSADGAINITQHDDVALSKLGRGYTEDAIWDLMAATIQKAEHDIKGTIVVPTSGGFDSRLINYFIEDKKRIKAYTYNNAEENNVSYNVVYAQAFCEKFGIDWQKVEVDDMLKYIDDWYEMYGPFTQLHGMHQFTFNKVIRQQVTGDAGMISGLIGDAWAGSIKYQPIERPEDLHTLSLSRGAFVDPDLCVLPDLKDQRIAFFEKHKEKLKDPRYRIVESMRTKLVLLNYLIRVPEQFGMEGYAPFLDPELSLAMLHLPDERREKRIWQKEFMQKHDIFINELALKASDKNVLFYRVMHDFQLKPLDPNLLKEIIDPNYVEHINKNILNSPWSRLRNKAKIYFMDKPYIWRYTNGRRVLDAYLGYLILYPMQELIIRRNKALKA